MVISNQETIVGSLSCKKETESLLLYIYTSQALIIITKSVNKMYIQQMFIRLIFKFWKERTEDRVEVVVYFFFGLFVIP